MSLRYLFLLAIISLSCNKDDNPTDNQSDGLINGKSFEISSARFSDDPDHDLLIEVFGEVSNSSNICAEEARGLRLRFVASEETGRQDLFIDTENFEAYYIELIDPDRENNIIATEGYYDILELSDQHIRIKLDITVDENSFVKAEFDASFCN